MQIDPWSRAAPRRSVAGLGALGPELGDVSRLELGLPAALPSSASSLGAPCRHRPSASAHLWGRGHRTGAPEICAHRPPSSAQGSHASGSLRLRKTAQDRVNINLLALGWDKVWEIEMRWGS